MIIAPGGAYALLTPTEANFVANKFYDKGYNTFVLSYTNNLTLDAPPKLQPLKDISRSVQYVRKNKDEFGIDANRVVICGFSAGGHLVGSLAVHHEKPELHQDDKYKDISNRADAAILHYPLVSGGKFAPRVGFHTLLGFDASADEIHDMSLEFHVNENTTPMFFLHGTADFAVSKQHSILLANACADCGIPYEVHLYHACGHGFTTGESSSPQETTESVYVFDQLYEYFKAASEEELNKYPRLFAGLNKTMSYQDFVIKVLQENMITIFLAALELIPVELQTMMESAAAQPAAKNKSVEYWDTMVDNWINMVV